MCCCSLLVAGYIFAPEWDGERWLEGIKKAGTGASCSGFFQIPGVYLFFGRFSAGNFSGEIFTCFELRQFSCLDLDYFAGLGVASVTGRAL